MKTFKLIATLLAVLMISASCEKIKEAIQSGKLSEIPLRDLITIFQKQKEFIESRDIDPAKRQEAIQKIQEIKQNIEKKYDALEKEGGKLACISMEYSSVDGKGQPITLSGKIYVPCIGDHNIMPINDIVVNLFGTLTQGTNKNILMTLAPYLYTYQYLALDHIAVFEPEYIGFGSSSSRLQTYLCQKLIARNCYDMLVAGFKLLKEDYHTTFKSGYGTYITGYSQGGGNAMSLARHMTLNIDSEAKKLYNLKRTICGDGPYDPAETFSTWIGKDGMTMSLILPMVLYGMNEVHPSISEGVDFKDYFYSDYWTSGIPTKVTNIEDGQFDASFQYDAQHAKEGGNKGLLGPEVPTTLIASTEALTAGTTKNTKLMNALISEQVCYDWTPEVRLTMFCEVNDDVVPYVNSKKAYECLYPKATSLVDSLHSHTGDHILSMILYNAYISKQLSK